MPHGVLAPLGRESRLGLAAFHRVFRSRIGQKRATSTHISSANATAVTVLDKAEGTCGIRRQTGRDWLADALNTAGVHAATPKPSTKKRSLSFVNVQRRDWKQKAWKSWTGKTRSTSLRLGWMGMRDMPLQRITARYIIHASAKNGECADLRITHGEIYTLRVRGFDVADAKTWVKIITEPDSGRAAAALERGFSARDESRAIPWFVLQSLLRRPHLNAAALRILIVHARRMLEWDRTRRYGIILPENARFVVFARLLRHAREVWPQAIDNITEMLLAHLSRFRSTETGNRRISRLTYQLNQAMRLISFSLSVAPFKDMTCLEAAILRILAFMAQHKPVLLLNREGYRAVVRLQLAQKKTPTERRWAELKALSWPPWKEDQTSMDAFVLPEHGITRAGDTLRRMREAGYAPGDWERTAELYTGWDTDRTPSVQVRTVSGTRTSRLHSSASVWAARISSTRTIQEAWAAFLAYEDTKVSPHSSVLLAIFVKLCQEEQRQRHERQIAARDLHPLHPSRRLLPGDYKEISPLPPSTHLYTYTRTPPPTMEGLFDLLRHRGVLLGDHCLAFVVANATSLQLGITYLLHGKSRNSSIIGLLSLDSSIDLAQVPQPIFGAFIQLLCRFSHVPMTKVHSSDIPKVSPTVYSSPPMIGKRPLNLHHPLVHALKLLELRRTTYRPIWNSVLRALTRQQTVTSMRFLLHGRKSTCGQYVSVETEQCQAAMTAYRLMRRTMSRLREMHINIDTTGFHSLCLVGENATFAVWRCLRYDVMSLTKSNAEHHERTKGLVREANALLRSSSHASFLKRHFNLLVGEQIHTLSSTNSDLLITSTTSTFGLPQLLVIPSPWLLHAYIRALGWLADYDGLVTLSKWITLHRSEILEQGIKDRNGEEMMRRAIIALRVFLERSWLASAKGMKYSTTYAAPASELSERSAKGLGALETPASESIVENIQNIFSDTDGWKFWPSDTEVEGYCQDRRFQQLY